MATATQIVVTANRSLEVASPRVSKESASKTSQVLQLNHEVNDIITNELGHHNHIVHGILTAYSLGASPEVIQKHYDRNSSYQRQPRNLDRDVVAKLSDVDYFMKNLTPFQTEMYLNWRQFFQEQIEKLGWREMLLKYTFADDARGRIMFSRLFAGTFHPLIHFGFAIEFEQPAILAEAIGQSCIHPHILDPWFEKVAAKANQPSAARDGLINLLDRIVADPKLSKSAKYADPHPIYAGVLVRAPEEMLQIASEWQVTADEVEEKTAELFNGAAYLVGGSLNPSKEIKFDFFYMHAVTSAIFMPLLNKQDWIPFNKRLQLLEWKGRYDLLLYASRGVPTPNLDEIRDHKPKLPNQTWDTLFERAAIVAGYQDDGHAAKFIRGLYRGAELCKPYEHKPAFRIRGDMWLQLATMVMDSVEGAEPRWVKGAGFAEAWEGFADRKVTAVSA